MPKTKKVLKDVIVEQLGINDLPKEDQDEIVAGISGNVLKSITLAILERVPKDDRPKFDAVKEKGDREEIKKFLQKYVSDLESLVEEETKKCIAEFRSIVASL